MEAVAGNKAGPYQEEEKNLTLGFTAYPVISRQYVLHHHFDGSSSL